LTVERNSEIGGVESSVLAGDEFEARPEHEEAALSEINLLRNQLEAMGAELQRVACDRDVEIKEKTKAQQQIVGLKKQLEAKCEELQDVVAARDLEAQQKANAQRQLDVATADLKSFQKEAKQTLLKLNQYQNKIEILTLENEQQKSEFSLKFEYLNKQLSVLGQQLKAVGEEKSDLSQNKKSLDIQLGKLQEDLEHYYLLYAKQNKLLESYSGLMQRVAVLMSETSSDIMDEKSASFKLDGNMITEHTADE
jgi:chromosome segregation ATPase